MQKPNNFSVTGSTVLLSSQSPTPVLDRVSFGERTCGYSMVLLWRLATRSKRNERFLAGT
jgi:hypothetical protein